jgi:hypothetical protein
LRELELEADDEGLAVVVDGTDKLVVVGEQVLEQSVCVLVRMGTIPADGEEQRHANVDAHVDEKRRKRSFVLCCRAVDVQRRVIARITSGQGAGGYSRLESRRGSTPRY